MLRPDKPDVKRYIEVLDSLNLKHVITKQRELLLIDHVITNLPKPVTHTDVLPCPLVSDHDGPSVHYC